jgi:hypothetical protein
MGHFSPAENGTFFTFKKSGGAHAPPPPPPPPPLLNHFGSWSQDSQSSFSLKYKQNIGRKLIEFGMEV